jgi:hypothetical protein
MYSPQSAGALPQLVKRAAALPYNSEFGADLVDILTSYT